MEYLYVYLLGLAAANNPTLVAHSATTLEKLAIVLMVMAGIALVAYVTRPRTY